jgi:hypothetical protein
MTRNREIDCEDLFGCDHEPEIAISDDSGEILFWRCRCGKVDTRANPGRGHAGEGNPPPAD